ncbi:MAG TPA: LysR family transcriptional regulator [Gammaproteobacteria bacterium]|nr:LysR family transcriptional regulator [Gammaproteobacteria bacterium]
MNITFLQMLTLDAVIRQGSIQSAARYLNKTHPSVITALKKLENELGFVLFDRSGYRSTLTSEGKAFYKSCQKILDDIDRLKTQAYHLSCGEEPELNIAIGDITPVPDTLKVLRKFSDNNKFTHLNLLFENLGGTSACLLDGKADLIIHHIDKSDPRYEYKKFCEVPVVPVAAPDFLAIPVSNSLKYTDLEKYTQCIIRSTASETDDKNYFVLEQAPHITVGDQYTKKEIIMQRMAWGHMPLFMIKDELDEGTLISIQGKFIKGHNLDIVVARLHKAEHGTMSERLWQAF